MSNEMACPEDSRHIHEERFIPGVPGVIPAPSPPRGEEAAPEVPIRGRTKTKTTTDEASDSGASVVEEA